MTEVSLSDWDDVGDLVDHALTLPSAGRQAYLRAACGSDSERLARAMQVLAAAERAHGFLAQPAAELVPGLIPPGREPAASAPTVLGPYRLLRLLGRGGMGEVFLAERADDEFTHRVAIKLVRAGLGQDLVARFRNERQVLASLDHPNIARLFDGGVADDGRPYLVMEYVDGKPMTRYADEASLTIDQRLQLFTQVCDAVERAHQRLIVHRDLKPANILVTADRTVKLLDFGVAKLLEASPGSDSAPMTQAGVRVMTPEYASPEQFLGEPTTTSTDVYALGVLLYELLTGIRPHEGAEGARTTLERAVLDSDAPLPSAVALGDSARGDAVQRSRPRGTSPDGLARHLRGDLDNIMLTALRREPDRRYASVADLREDIERHRSGLPVAARPLTMGYRAGKFVRRHRVAVLAATLVVFVTVAGITSTVSQARAAAREGRRAEQIRDVLMGVFEISDPDRSRGEAVTARELLDAGTARIRQDPTMEPPLRAEMLGTLGKVYTQLGLYDEARPLFDDALEIRRRGPATPLELVDSLTDVANARLLAEQPDEAEDLAREALDVALAAEGARSPTAAAVMSDLGAMAQGRGDYEAAERIHREALAVRRAIGDPGEIANSLQGLGVALDESGRSLEAVLMFEEAIALGGSKHGDDHTTVIRSQCSLAKALHGAGKLDEALAAFDDCVDARRQRLGDAHPDVGLALNNMAGVHLALSQFDEAEQLHLEALAIRRQTFGEFHRDVAGSLNNLAVIAYQKGEFRAAGDRFAALVEVWGELVGPDHPNTLATLNNLGMVRRAEGDLAESDRILFAVLDGRRRALGTDHVDVVGSLVNLSAVALLRNHAARAAQLAAEAIETSERMFEEAHPIQATSYLMMSRALLAQERHADALASAERSLRMREEILGIDNVQTADARAEVGRALAALGRVADGLAEMEAALAVIVDARGADNEGARRLADDVARLRR